MLSCLQNLKSGASIMEADDHQITTVFTIGTRQTEYHEALPTSANDEVRCDCTFAGDGNASWYSVCRVPIVEWQLDCRHVTVVDLHDTGPCCSCYVLRDTTCHCMVRQSEYPVHLPRFAYLSKRNLFPNAWRSHWYACQRPLVFTRPAVIERQQKYLLWLQPMSPLISF